MLALYVTLNVLSGIVYVGFLIWLCVEAFKVKPWWPVVILLTCGLGAVVFKWMNRESARNPYRYALSTFLVLRLICFLIPTDSLVRDAQDKLSAFTNELAQAMLTNQMQATLATPADPAAPNPPPEVAPPATPIPRPARTRPATPKPVPAPVVDVAPATPAPAPATPPAAGATILVEPAAPAKPAIEITRSDLTINEGIGTISLEVTNRAPQLLTEVKLTISYMDKRGVKVGQWNTLRKLAPAVDATDGNGRFTEMAIRLPPSAVKVSVAVTAARLADGTTIEY